MLSKIELFNARNASNAISAGLEIKVVSVGSYEDTDKDGNPVIVSVLKAQDNELYTCISATVAESLEMLQDCIADSETGVVTVRVIESVSNNGRKFYQLKIIA
jgi:hypothetical protein